jgi:hypothetical protein
MPRILSSSYKLITIISAAITTIVPAIVAAAIAVVGSIVPTSAVGTATRRWRTAGRRRRWGVYLAAAAGPVISADGSKHDGTVAIDIGSRAEGFGSGRNRCNSECEGCRRHSSYPAEFQHQHDTSPVIFLAVVPPFQPGNGDIKQRRQLDFGAANSRYVKIW